MRSKRILSNLFKTTAGFCLIWSLPTNGQNQMPADYPSTVKGSYIRTWNAVMPDTNTNHLILTNYLKQLRSSSQYFDGLGRPVETVAKNGSMVTGSGAVDFVSPNVYDPIGREKYKYLPFASNNTGSNTHISDG